MTQGDTVLLACLLACNVSTHIFMLYEDYFAIYDLLWIVKQIDRMINREIIKYTKNRQKDVEKYRQKIYKYRQKDIQIDSLTGCQKAI